MNIDRFLSKPYLFRRIVTLSVEEFQTLATKLYPEWKTREYERLSGRKNRIRAIGQGRKYKLGSFDNLLLLVVIYLRTNIGYDLLALLFDIDPATVKRTIARVVPLLQDRFIPKTKLTARKRRINTLDELLEEYPEMEDVIFDGSEMSCKRPKKRQKQSYSGKKKRHTKKIQVALDKRNNIIVGVSPPKKGKIHDKKQLEQTGWNDKLADDINRWGDTAYMGMEADINDASSWIIPSKSSKKYALSKEQKRSNRRISSQRIKVEHAIRKMKVFRRIAETLTTKTDEYLYSLILASANLVNYKTLVRQGLN